MKFTYMCRFYELYPNAQQASEGKLPQVGAELKCQQVVDDSERQIRPQLVDDLEIIFYIPWGHNKLIIDKCRDNPDKAFFYVRKTLENGWSRAMLLNFLDTDLYERQGKAITNFAVTLPGSDSDLAREITKDPYNFDFLTLTERYNEKVMKDALMDNAEKFFLLICKDKDEVEAQYALESSSQPLGISSYELSQIIPEEYKGTLPGMEEMKTPTPMRCIAPMDVVLCYI